MVNWIAELAYPVMKACNIVLFFLFAPERKKLGNIGRAIYRGLVKLTVLEFRLKTRAMEQCPRRSLAGETVEAKPKPSDFLLEPHNVELPAKFSSDADETTALREAVLYVKP